jgi:hypothetical protein
MCTYAKPLPEAAADEERAEIPLVVVAVVSTNTKPEPDKDAVTVGVSA